MNRRRFMVAASFGLTGWCFAGRMAEATEEFPESAVGEIPTIERASGGTLGVAILDTATGATANYRGDQRFPMCSTFKLLAVSAVLAKVDAGREQMDRLIRFEAKDVVAYSPVTEARAGGAGMPLREICAAAIMVSDNTAGNLLLASIGGPAGLTRFARSLGDGYTRLDRIEPDLNESLPGDARDTTTPLAMMRDVHALVLGKALSSASRDQLTQWMLGCKTGVESLRAGLPQQWREGDKTGSGKNGSANDVAVVWPADRAPLIVTVYSTGSAGSYDERCATIAHVGMAVAKALDRKGRHVL